MPRRILVAALLLAAACTPTFNWREMTVDALKLHAMFPCKPDRAERNTPLAPGREILLHAMGCEAGGASFIVVYGDVGDAGDAAEVLAQWKEASLAAAKAKAVQSQASYFARGPLVIQAAVHAPHLKPEMTEPFFAGLRFE
ncbi:MAG TPA: hypothetical protein VMZ74_03240 [Ramlibacter sp.]|nr:hypothetical protein [Ramlibacter sp.]